MWLKGAIVDVGLDAASVDVLCMMLIATAQHKPGKPRLLLSYSDSRTKTSRLYGMLSRVADLIIREAPVKLNLRFEELASVMGLSSADSGQPRAMAQLGLAHKKVS